MAMRKVTFTLDEETAATIDRLAARLRIPKSRLVREAVTEYAASGSAGKPSPEERERMLKALDQHLANLPPRPPGAAAREIAEIRRARRHFISRGSLEDV
jgi:predicted transcriptional regulator